MASRHLSGIIATFCVISFITVVNCQSYCTTSLLRLCLDAWTDGFENEPWIDQSLQPMQPYQRKKWCSRFQREWDKCLEFQLSYCTDEMRDELLGLNYSQSVLCTGMTDWDYEQMWRCLQIEGDEGYQGKSTVCKTTFDIEVSTILNMMDSTHESYDVSYTTGYDDICSAVKTWYSCTDDAALTSCGEKAAWFAAEYLYQRNRLSMQTSLECTLDVYVSPASSCDTTGAEGCITDSQVYWNEHFSSLTEEDAAVQLATLGGCLYKTLDECEVSDQSQYLDITDQNSKHLTALSYNSTLTHFIEKTVGTGDETVACTEYTDIDEPDRSTAAEYSKLDQGINDTTLNQSKWYRFTAYTGTDLSLIPVAADRCGNSIPVWVDGTQGGFPSVEFDVEIPNTPASVLTVCTNVSDDGTCFWKNTVKVKLCIDEVDGISERFHVYNLQPLPSTLMTYCAGSKKPCDPDFVYNEALDQCKQGVPEMTAAPAIENPVLQEGDILISCNVAYPREDDGARFVTTWYLDDQLIPGSSGVVTSTEGIGTLLGSQLPAGAVGSDLTCKVYSYWLGWDDQQSTVLTSDGYILQAQAIIEVTVNEMDTTSTSIVIPQPLPFACDGDSTITLDIQGSPHITVDSCTLDLCNTESVSLSVRAKKDKALKVSTFDSQITFSPAVATGAAADLWNQYMLPAVTVAIEDSIHGSQCHYISHGQVKAMDNQRLLFDQSGTFVLWSNTEHREVQLRTIESLACGVAVREGNLVLGVDLCNEARPYPVLFKKLLGSEGNNDGSITVGKGGMSFEIHVLSGMTVKVYIQTSAGSDRLVMTVSVQDQFVDGAEDGMCKTGGSDQDINSNYRIVQSDNRNLFEDSTNCDNGEPWKSTCSCDEGKTVCDGPIENLVTPENWQSSCVTSAKRKKRNIPNLSDTGAFSPSGYKFDYDDDDTTTEPTSYSWPSISGITEEQATEACENTFYSSTVYQRCLDIIDIQGLLSVCIQEIKIGDDLDLALSSSVVSVMEDSCQLQLEYDVVLGSENEASQMNATQEVAAAICPALCSGKGTCDNGVCVCNEGSVGSDCGLEEGEAPHLWAVEETQCDIQQRPWQLIRVYGHGFWDSGSLGCRITHVDLSEDGAHTVTTTVDYTTASINSAYEIMCEIPVTPVSSEYTGESRQTEHGVTISVTTDGLTYSEDIMIVIYDSQCRSCTENGICSTLENTCHYDGVCLPVSDCDDPCVDYTDLGHPRRSTAYNIQDVDSPTVICDQLGIGNGAWYRFDQYTGGQMPESCVEPYHCATQSPIWLQGTHPNADNPGPVTATVCANKPSLEEVDSNCCDWSDSIQIKYCALSVEADSYYVYQLSAAPECEMAYCAGDQVPCEDGYDWDADIQTCYEMDECLSNPCLHGNCTDLLNHFTCTCDPGYTGTSCQVDIDECALGSDCQNSGVCVDGENGYSCTCTSGYAGTRCEQEANECESQPCVNGGTCSDLFDAYTCECAETFTGTDCLLGEWGEWSDWSNSCSRSCGHGRVSSTRECASMATCYGDSVQYALCQQDECEDTYSDENMKGAVITIPYSDLEKAVLEELDLIDVLVRAMNYYCETHKHDFCESFGLESTTMMMSPEPGMITAGHIEVKFITVVREDTDPITMIQVIVTAETDDITQYCATPDDMTELPEQVHLEDGIVRDAIIQYSSIIEVTMEIEVENVQTTADALSSIETSTEGPSSTKVPLIVAGAIFGTVAIIVALCVARGIYRSKCVKERAKRTISKVSVNPIVDGGPETSRPTTPASLFSASSFKVDGRPLSGTSTRPHSGTSGYRPYSGTTGRPYSGASSRPFSGAFGRQFPGLSRPSSAASGRPMSSGSTKSNLIIPAVPVKNILNPRVTSIYEQVLNDKSNFSDGKRSAGHPTRISSINFEEMKSGSGAAKCQKTLLLQKDPVLESDGLPAAAGTF